MKLQTTEQLITGMAVSPILIIKALCYLYLGCIMWIISKGRKMANQ